MDTIEGPKHRTVCGYIDRHGKWMYSVYDGSKYDWVDVGYDPRKAEEYASSLPDVTTE